jgi:6-pyruvoyltetrahydropterin/6-carboxytetrahydropterin synthase
MSRKFTVTKIFKFEMAHILEESYSKECQNMHGHSYKLEVTFSGDLNEAGMILDFKEIKEMVSPLIDQFDHECLTKEKFFGMNPTAENMANYIFNKIRENTPYLDKVKLWETDTCFVEVYYS